MARHTQPMKGKQLMAPSNNGTTAIGGTSPTNDGELDILSEAPFVAEVTITGDCPVLFHRWSNEAVAEKAAAKKGSAAKKSDNVESYTWRNDDGLICLPGIYLLGSMCDPRNGAAKYRQDPRSTRKSALDLFRAGVVALTDLAPITSAKTGEFATDWDYIDQRRVTVQRAGVTRSRPAFLAGWSATLTLMVQTPEYISPALLHDVLTQGGKLVGVGDFRPTFGRFRIDRFDVGFDS